MRPTAFSSLTQTTLATLVLWSALIVPAEAGLATARAKPSTAPSPTTSASAASKPEELFEQQLILPPSGPYALDLQNLRGRIRVRGWDKNDIYVHATKHTTNPPAGEEAGYYAHVNVLAEQHALGHVVVKTLVPGTGEFARVAAERVPHIEVDYEVFVPPNCAVTVSEEDGPVLVAGVTGKVEAFSRDGDLALTDVNGWAEASNERGNLHFVDVTGDAIGKSLRGSMRFVGVTGDVKAATATGNIRIEVPARQVCEVAYHTVSGRFRSNMTTYHTDMEPGDKGYRGILRGPLAAHDRPLVRYSIDTESGDAIVASERRPVEASR